MKIVLLVAAVCCLGLAQAVSHDEIEDFMRKSEEATKCVIDSHGDIDDVEDFVERLESLAVGNGKIKQLRDVVAAFLKAMGQKFDDTRGFFGLSVDIWKGVKQAYDEGKDDEVLYFVEGLLSIITDKDWEEVGKVMKDFTDAENLGHCAPVESKRGLGARKYMSVFYSLLSRVLLGKTK